MQIWEILLLAVALSMDACTVGMANGMLYPKMPVKKVLLIGLFFGFFQFLMPVIGYYITEIVTGAFMDAFKSVSAWISFGLLAFLGGRMLWEGIQEFRVKKLEKEQACPCMKNAENVQTTGAGMRSPTIMQTVGESGYGRVYDVAPLTLDELTAGIKKEFSTERVAVYGDGKKTVARVASFCGAGGDERAVAFAKRNGADVIVSADFKHHVITYAVETGLSVIALTHYASENYGFEKYYEKIRRQIEVPCVFHTDRELL